MPNDPSDKPPEPDHGASLVWSTEAPKRAQALLAKNNGDVNKSLKDLFGGSTSYDQARVLAETFAEGFGLTVGKFIWKYYAWRRGEL
ncbi:MAG: hypothetical protein WCC04_17130 [Terriglobales bacterium]